MKTIKKSIEVAKILMGNNAPNIGIMAKLGIFINVIIMVTFKGGYIPLKREKLRIWADKLYLTCQANIVAWGLDSAELTALNAKRTSFNSSYDAWLPKPTRDAQNRAAVKSDQVAYVPLLRALVQGSIKYNTTISHDMKVFMEVPDGVVRNAPTPASARQDSPVISLAKNNHLLQVIRLTDPEVQHSQETPVNQMYVLQRFIGAPNTPQEQMQWGIIYVGKNHLIESKLDALNVGKVAYYRAFFMTASQAISPASVVSSFGVW